MKKIFATVLLLSLTILAPNASALSSAVYFEGGADNFVFYPGTEWSEVDLFDGFKNIMPGDKLTETIKVRNTAPEYDYVKIYLRADTHGSTNPLSDAVADKETTATMSDFLSQLSMRVYNGSKLIYDASPDQLGGLKTNVLLGKFANGASTTLKVELSVPKTLGNAYMRRAGEVDWVFVAEGYKDDKTCNCPNCCDCQKCESNSNSGGGKPKPLPSNAYTLDDIAGVVTLCAVFMVGLVVACALIRKYIKDGKIDKNK